MKQSTWRAALAVPYVMLWQISFIIGLPAIYTALLSLFVIFFIRPAQLRMGKPVYLAAVYVAAYITMLIEPGVAFGKLHVSSAGTDLAVNILYSILLSASLVAMMQGIIMKAFWKKPFVAMTMAAAVYVFTVTPVNLFLNPSGLPQLLLFNTSFILILSYYLGFLYLKSNFNVLPVLVFLILYSVFSQLGVTIITSQLFLLVWEVVSLSVVLFITELTLRESLIVKRAFRTKKVRRRSRISPWAVVAGVLVLLVLVVILPLATHETHYAIADPTDSMYPIIHPGSLLIVSYIPVKSVHVGSVIVFHAPWEKGTLFAHQVIKIYYQNGVEYFVTKGVNNPAKDPLPVPANELVGKVAIAIPYLGLLLIYSKVTAAIIVLSVGASFARESRR